MNRLTPTLLALLLCITAARADDPYKEGIRDYHSGLCYRARPYLDGPPEKAVLWERGFRDAQRRDRNRVNRSHCRPSGHRELGSRCPLSAANSGLMHRSKKHLY